MYTFRVEATSKTDGTTKLFEAYDMALLQDGSDFVVRLCTMETTKVERTYLSLNDYEVHLSKESV